MIFPSTALSEPRIHCFPGLFTPYFSFFALLRRPCFFAPYSAFRHFYLPDFGTTCRGYKPPNRSSPSCSAALSAVPSLLPTSVFFKNSSSDSIACLFANSSANHLFSSRFCHCAVFVICTWQISSGNYLELQVSADTDIVHFCCRPGRLGLICNPVIWWLFKDAAFAEDEVQNNTMSTLTEWLPPSDW